jgi:hypothetical protein
VDITEVIVIEMIMRDNREIGLGRVGRIIESPLKAHAKIGIDNDSATVIEVDSECGVCNILDLHLKKPL